MVSVMVIIAAVIRSIAQFIDCDRYSIRRQMFIWRQRKLSILNRNIGYQYNPLNFS